MPPEQKGSGEHQNTSAYADRVGSLPGGSDSRDPREVPDPRIKEIVIARIDPRSERGHNQIAAAGSLHIEFLGRGAVMRKAGARDGNRYNGGRYRCGPEPADSREKRGALP